VNLALVVIFTVIAFLFSAMVAIVQKMGLLWGVLSTAGIVVLGIILFAVWTLKEEIRKEIRHVWCRYVPSWNGNAD
jgi:hypothetical protein